ncbi:MAG: hypothetical protein ACR2GZ_03660 [Solirubrobacteraceae bacterium]
MSVQAMLGVSPGLISSGLVRGAIRISATTAITRTNMKISGSHCWRKEARSNPPPEATTGLRAVVAVALIWLIAAALSMGTRASSAQNVDH